MTLPWKYAREEVNYAHGTQHLTFRQRTEAAPEVHGLVNGRKIISETRSVKRTSIQIVSMYTSMPLHHVYAFAFVCFRK